MECLALALTFRTKASTLRHSDLRPLRYRLSAARMRTYFREASCAKLLDALNSRGKQQRAIIRSGCTEDRPLVMEGVEMPHQTSEHESILRDYLKEIEHYYKLGISKEHSYRSSLQTLLPKLAPDITAVNEPKRVACGAPDYVVLRATANVPLTVGYIEAKDIGLSLDKIEKDEQMGRYLRALDNLLLTDYIEFRWYVKSQKQMTARLATPQGGKSLVLNKTELETVHN